jgi:hypothetical protein
VFRLWWTIEDGDVTLVAIIALWGGSGLPNVTKIHPLLVIIVRVEKIRHVVVVVVKKQIRSTWEWRLRRLRDTVKIWIAGGLRKIMMTASRGRVRLTTSVGREPLQ